MMHRSPLHIDAPCALLWRGGGLGLGCGRNLGGGGTWGPGRAGDAGSSGLALRPGCAERAVETVTGVAGAGYEVQVGAVTWALITWAMVMVLVTGSWSRGRAGAAGAHAPSGAERGVDSSAKRARLSRARAAARVNLRRSGRRRH